MRQMLLYLFMPSFAIDECYVYSGYGLVVIFTGHYEFRANDSDGVDGQDDPADCAQDPGFVQFPADEEAVVVVVEVCLSRL